MGKKILIVEDEAQLRSAVRLCFEKEGFTVVQARDGEEGLLIALKEKPDVILLDIIMPKIDGLTMLKILREDPWGKDVPVFMLTNVAESNEISVAMQSKANRYIIKANTKLEDIVKEVKGALSSKETS